MAETSVTLLWNMQTQGMSGVQNDLNKLRDGAAQAQTAMAKPPNVAGWQNQVGSVKNNLQGLGREILKIGALIGIGFGIKEVLGQWTSLEKSMLRISFAMDLDAESAAKLKEEFTEMAMEIGKAPAEIANIADNLNDVGIAWDRAVKAAPKVALFADTVGISPNEMTDLYGMMRQMAGDEISDDQLLAYIGDMIRNSNLPEDVFVDVVKRNVGQLSGVGGLEGLEGMKQFTGMIAVLAETYRGKPREISSAMDSLTTKLLDDKFKKGLEKLPVDLSTTATAFYTIIEGLQGHKFAIEDIKDLPDDLKEIFMASVKHVDSYNKGVNSLVGDVAGLDKRLEHAADVDPFAKIMNAATIALMPLAEELGSWLREKMPDIISSLQWFMEALVSAIAFIKDLVGEGPSEADKALAKQQLQEQGVLLPETGGSFWNADDLLNTVRNMDAINTRAKILQVERESPTNRRLEENIEIHNREREEARFNSAKNSFVASETGQAIGADIRETQSNIVDAILQGFRNIGLNIQTTVTPEGVTTEATARTNGRAASAPMVATS